jgi:hypothetical protein
MGRKYRACALLLAILTATSCVPYATSEGELGQKVDRFAFITLLSWWNLNRFTAQDGVLLRETRPEETGDVGQVLHISLFGHHFDATADMRFWNSDQRQEWLLGYAKEAHVILAIARAGTLSDNTRLVYDTDDPPATDQGPYILGVPSWTLAPEPVKNKDEYPDTVRPNASRVIVTVEITKAERDINSLVEGTVEIKLERTDSDPVDAIDGSFSAEFKAQVLGERLAECNYGNAEDGAGQPDACAVLDAK